ncbi:type III-B CRISPR module RAMP protein Cmr6 [Nocardiopsis aegyptia]|uniref:CRISPR-associated protein Cmr6 n=1 Tax=Nocardiopsis aegyptia TaxID=220378 RepID=A0A7Z0EKE0_9ACTN|nr:type III-B CRISPR module RAMP protein Cmr6 [Nocardiopsis aegyptia]NYJ32860.1 CRISPR-associated protein Cmr6 [Nocardiopsis aegyptia]
MPENSKGGRKPENPRPTPGDTSRGAAHGPLGSRVWVHQKPHPKKGDRDAAKSTKGPAPGHTTLKFGRHHVEPHANALVVLHRLAFEKMREQKETQEQGKLEGWQPHTPLHTWATECGAGQQRNPYLDAVLKRRRALLERMTAPRTTTSGALGRPRTHVLRLRLATEWRLVTGLGLQYGVLDSGLALHGTYGWPVIPASTLKGLAAAGARLTEADQEQVRRILGDPRPEDSPATSPPQGRGGAVFLDALPEARGVSVHSDTLTPHQQPYYTDTFPSAESEHNSGQGRTGPSEQVDRNGTEGKGGPRPPAEHHSPVPVPFLSVSGCLHVDLLGDDHDDLRTVADWLGKAGDEVGGGGRTSASHGYFTCDVIEEEAW